MKPYGMQGKLEMAPCGCCAKHPNQDSMFPWRSTSVKKACRKQCRHAERFKVKKEIALENESPD